MKCPKCGTNVNGVNNSCPICGYIPLVSTEEKNNEKYSHNAIGIIDKRDYFNTNRNMEEYKEKKRYPNLTSIIIIVLLIIVIFILVKLITILF